MKILITACKFFMLMSILTGFLYPSLITGISQLVMPKRANGSLIYIDGQVRGSVLIAQKTTANNYFWPRPSAVDFDPLKPSGGSNFGPTSAKLKKAVAEREKILGNESTAELVFASGSGLDPHISLQTAFIQIPRIAKARALSEDRLKELIYSLKEGKQFGFLGSYYVNVLLLNKALDDIR